MERQLIEIKKQFGALQQELIENKLNQINLNEKFPRNNSQIVLTGQVRARYTKEAFHYFEVKMSQPLFQQLTHPQLLRPLFYGNGLLYPRGESNMQIELNNRKRAFSKDFFSEDELVNTFLPLFQCLDYLQTNRIVHGQIHPESIVIIDGQVKLRDWLIQIRDNVYYEEQKKQNRTRFDDFIAIGQILAQYATLKKQSDLFQDKDIPSAIESIIDVYSKNLIFVLMVLLKRKTELFTSMLSLMQNKENNLLENPQLNALYAKIKTDKATKIIKQQPTERITNIIPTPKKLDNILVPSSPNKKFNITQTAKKTTHRLDDTQNKKVFNEEVKKRQIQKITKIIERSNAFVNELMARKNTTEYGVLKSNSEHNGVKNFGQMSNQQHVLKKISGKNNVNSGATVNNMSMYAVEPAKKIKEAAVGVTFSPSKRLRTISRKK